MTNDAPEKIIRNIEPVSKDLIKTDKASNDSIVSSIVETCFFLRSGFSMFYPFMILLPNGPALSCGVVNFRHATNETSPTTKVFAFAPDLCLAMLIAPSWQPST
jgi:hypothetical protein